MRGSATKGRRKTNWSLLGGVISEAFGGFCTLFGMEIIAKTLFGLPFIKLLADLRP